MIWLLSIMLSLIFTIPLQAQVIVKSGEHDGFTRLVMNYGHEVDWQVGRSEDGYELRIALEDPDYDISQAFTIIGKSRLASIGVDEANNALQFTLGCACHAKAFEFRPGIIVVDIHDGTPPKDSRFEEPLETSPIRPDNFSLVEDILALVKPETASPAEVNSLASQLVRDQYSDGRPDTYDIKGDLTSKSNLLNIRNGLIEQIGVSASRGLIDLSEDLPSMSSFSHAERSAVDEKPPGSGVGIALFPGIDISKSDDPRVELTPSGLVCIETQRVDLSNWRDEAPILEQLSKVNQDIVGEFDRPNEQSVFSAVRLLISIGFGAEARALLTNFSADGKEVDVLKSLSYIVDGERDPSHLFQSQEQCNTASSLWGALDLEDGSSNSEINIDSMFLAFSSLPIDQRLNLGPKLVNVLSSRNHQAAAEKVIGAIERAPEGASGKVELLSAEVDLAQNNPDLAERSAQTLLDDPGPELAEALVTKVEARAAQNLPVDLETVTALESIFREKGNSDTGKEIRAALALAYAQSGDFSGAFHLGNDVPEIIPDVWRLLAWLGTDEHLLKFAVLPSNDAGPAVSDETRSRIAGRLSDYGMIEAASGWGGQAQLQNVNSLANAAVIQGDPRLALSILSGVDNLESTGTRAVALRKLGQFQVAAQLSSELQDVNEELRTLRLARDWAKVEAISTEPWKSAASLVLIPTIEKSGGTLGRAHDLVLEADKVQKAISALISQ